MSKTSKYFVWSFAIAILFIAVHGYQFNSSDQEEHLPQVYKLHDASLYKGDYVVESLLGEFSIRFFYVRTIYFLSLFLPVSVTCFVLQVLLLTVTAYFIIRLSYLFLNNAAASIASCFLGLVVMNHFTVGGNNVEDSMLTCTVFANTACWGAWFYFFKRNYAMAFALAGIASLFQLLMGLHVFILMTVLIYILEQERKISKIILSAAVYILFSSLMLLPILYRQFFLGNANSNELFYYVLFVFRNPNHYLPSFFSVNDYLKSAVLLLAGLTSVLILKPKWAKDFFLLCGLIIGGMLLYFVLLEKFNLLFIGKLQWFKTCMWLSVFCSIAVCSWLVQLPLLQKLSTSIIISQCAIVFSLVFLFLILNSKYLPLKKLKHRYAIGNYPKSDLTLMHEWIHTNINKEALFVSFPSDDSFLCEAKRPLIVAYKAVIHESWFMVPWYIEFLNTYRLHDNVQWEMKQIVNNTENSYCNYNNFNYLKHKGVKYRIDDISKCNFIKTLGKPIFRQGNYLLTML